MENKKGDNNEDRDAKGFLNSIKKRRNVVYVGLIKISDYYIIYLIILLFLFIISRTKK